MTSRRRGFMPAVHRFLRRVERATCYTIASMTLGGLTYYAALAGSYLTVVELAAMAFIGWAARRWWPRAPRGLGWLALSQHPVCHRPVTARRPVSPARNHGTQPPIGGNHMSYDDLPTRSPNDRPINGPHRIVGEPGIREHLVFAGPNTWPRPAKPRRLREAVHYLYNVAYAFSIVVAVITAGLLALEYPQLSVPSRLACGTITVLVCAWVTVRRIRHRRAVRS